MTVQSARVQVIVAGDDVVLTHQIMKDTAYNAERSRVPVLVNTGDVVKFFYPNADTTSEDTIGYIGAVVGSYPNSIFTVTIPGVIAPVGVTPERGTTIMAIGYAQTVRVEITRVTSNKLETYYLLKEIDILGRGFPTSIHESELILP